MKKTHLSRLIVVIVALSSMLFMQLALAGYVCPKASEHGHAPDMATMTAATVDMPGCEKMDAMQPGLCHASAHTVHQSLDKYELPSVQPFVPATVFPILTQFVTPNFSTHFELNPALLSGAAPPPLAIRHCCFRI